MIRGVDTFAPLNEGGRERKRAVERELAVDARERRGFGFERTRTEDGRKRW